MSETPVLPELEILLTPDMTAIGSLLQAEVEERLRLKEDIKQAQSKESDLRMHKEQEKLDLQELRRDIVNMETALVRRKRRFKDMEQSILERIKAQQDF